MILIITIPCPDADDDPCEDQDCNYQAESRFTGLNQEGGTDRDR